MPYVTISLKEGRTIEQKRALVKAVTEVFVWIFNAKLDAVHIVLHDEPVANFVCEGILLVDRT